MPSAFSVSEPKLGPVSRATVSVSLGRSVSVSFHSTEPCPPTSVVAVPPSASVIASSTATGSLSLTGVMVIVTVPVSVTPPLASETM